MTELEIKIQKAANDYYRDGSSEYTDEEFDKMMEELRNTQPDSLLLKDGVQEELKGVSKKYKLDITMGTLAKCNSNNEIKKWWISHPHDNLLVSLKIDGNGIYLAYRGGKFIYARSRGDGKFGLDYTEKVLKIKNFPKQLKSEFNGYIRGEVYMLKSVWEKYFNFQKNPRNTAAGILSKKNNEDCKFLNFIAYDVFDLDNIVDNTKKDKFIFLQNENIDVPEYIENPSLEQVIEWKDKLNTDGEIPCDGIVCCQNIVDKEDLKRMTPLNDVAFKPELQIAISELIDIEWSMSGSFFSPVGIIKPVEISGATVSRASLSNINIMLKLGIKKGDKIFVERRGMIIPKIIGKV